MHTPSTSDRVLVTGGAGFIGSHLVEQLVASGRRVTVVDNMATGRLANLHRVEDSIQIYQADLGSLLADNQLELDRYGYVFHLAANPYIPPSVLNPAYDYETNLRNSFWLLEAFRRSTRRPRLINFSSAAVYGNPLVQPIRESDPTVPISPYGVSKLAAERYVAVYSELYGLRASSLRLFSVYGPRQRKQVVFDLIQRLAKDPERLEVLGDGTQARDFAHVSDVVHAALLVSEQAPGQGETYNVASGHSHTINQLVEALGQVCKLAPEVKYSGSIRPGDAERWAVDISRLTQLGYAPKVSLLEGLQATKTWFDAEFH